MRATRSRARWARRCSFARDIQAGRGTAHLERMIEVLESYPYRIGRGSTADTCASDRRVGLITP